MPAPFKQPFAPLVCAQCLGEGRAQRLKYRLEMDIYNCPFHGRVLTAEFLYKQLTKGR